MACLQISLHSPKVTSEVDHQMVLQGTHNAAASLTESNLYGINVTSHLH